MGYNGPAPGTPAFHEEMRRGRRSIMIAGPIAIALGSIVVAAIHAGAFDQPPKTAPFANQLMGPFVMCAAVVVACFCVLVTAVFLVELLKMAIARVRNAQ